MNVAAERTGDTTAEPDAVGWRVVDPESGDPVFVCPRCWPVVAEYWRRRANVTVRVVGTRPDWARCGVCDPERVC